MHNSKPILLLQSKCYSRDSPTRREAGCFSVKNETRQAAALRQITLLFNKNVNRLTYDLKEVIGDVEGCMSFRPSTSQIQDIQSQRDNVYKQGADKLAKCVLKRNSEICKARDAYRTQYNERTKKPMYMTICQEQTRNKSQKCQSRLGKRPISSKPSKQLSRSLIVNKLKVSRQPPTIVEAISRFTDFQCRELPKFFRIMEYSPRINNFKEQSTERSPEAHSIQLDRRQRATFPEYEREFLASFGSRRTSRAMSNHNRQDGLETLRAKINIQNSNFQVKVTKQQVYRKRQRDLKPLVHFLF